MNRIRDFLHPKVRHLEILLAEDNLVLILHDDSHVLVPLREVPPELADDFHGLDLTEVHDSSRLIGELSIGLEHEQGSFDRLEVEEA